MITDLALFYPVLNSCGDYFKHASSAGVCEYAAVAGNPVTSRGQLPAGVLFLTRGSVRISRSPVGNGRSVMLYRLMPGDLCVQSVISVFTGKPSDVDVVAETDIAGAVFETALFLEMNRDRPEVRSWIISRVAQRFGGLIELVDDLAFGRLDKRLARRLLQDPATLRMTHQKIADEMGSAREVISRLLKDFENRGAIRRQRRHIQVANAAALRAVADFPDPDGPGRQLT